MMDTEAWDEYREAGTFGNPEVALAEAWSGGQRLFNDLPRHIVGLHISLDRAGSQVGDIDLT